MSEGDSFRQTGKTLIVRKTSNDRFGLIPVLMAVMLIVPLLFALFLSEETIADEAASEKVILVGILENWPPAYLIDQKTGEPTGFANDVIRAVARRSGHDIQFRVFRSWPALQEAARNGEIEVIPNMGITEDRRSDYLFSQPYETLRVHLFVRSTSTDITGIQDLQNKTLGVVARNIGVVLAQDLSYRNLKTYANLEKAFFQLLSGGIDALIYPASIMDQIARESGLQERIRKAGNPLLEVKRGIAVVRERPELLVVLNTALRDLLDSDEYQEIFEKWYQAPEPFWNTRRVAYVMGVTLAVVVLLLLIWRFISIWRLNRKLQQSMIERELAQKALKESESRFRQLAENIREVFWVVSPDWQTVEYISPTYEEVWGRSCQSLYDNPRSWMEVIPAEDRREIERYIQEATAGEFTEIVFPLFRVERPDGTSRWIAARGFAVFNEAGQIFRIAGIAEDITEKKLAEEALKRAKENLEIRVEERTEEISRLLSAVEQSPNVVVITDCDGIIEYVNPKFSSIYGYSKEEVIGQKTAILQADNIDRETFASIWQTIKSGKEWRGEFHNRKKNGERVWQLVSISPVISTTGEISHFIASQENIDQKKEAEFKLQEAKQAAENANQAKSAFLANMSHELRTPLNAVIGFAQILEKQAQGVLESKQLVFLKHIREAGDHLLNMVNDVLDLSKIEADKVDLEFKPFDLRSMLERSPLTIQSIAEKKQIRIETDIPENLGWLIGDETRIKQVIFNFLSNAFKFTDQGKRIGITARSEADEVFITVWDEGVGISQKDLERIFKPFEQVKSAVGTEGGTGLGLAISKRIVELHGGSIDVASNLNSGSRFTIRFPGRIADPDVADDSANDSRTVGPTQEHRGQRILVTEDNAANRQLIEAALESEGFHLDFAVNGEDAVAMSKDTAFDLVLMDIQLPGMSGVEAMKAIKQDSRKTIPIIALTAFAMKGDQQAYLRDGFDDYVSKPIIIDRLLEVIQTHLV